MHVSGPTAPSSLATPMFQVGWWAVKALKASDGLLSLSAIPKSLLVVFVLSSERLKRWVLLGETTGDQPLQRSFWWWLLCWNQPPFEKNLRVTQRSSCAPRTVMPSKLTLEQRKVSLQSQARKKGVLFKTPWTPWKVSAKTFERPTERGHLRSHDQLVQFSDWLMWSIPRYQSTWSLSS